MDKNKQREYLRAKILGFKPTRRKKIERWPGDKKSGVCPRCSSKRYDFDGRYKHCDTCGYDTWAERNVKYTQRMIKLELMDEIKTINLVSCVKYINELMNADCPKNMPRNKRSDLRGR